jgi:hypothetical protein
MAAIDKTYGTHDEWLQLRAWLKDHYPIALKQLYPEPPSDGEEYCLSNFTFETDRYLIQHCELEFVRTGLIHQGYEVPENPVKLLLKKKRENAKSRL